MNDARASGAQDGADCADSSASRANPACGDLFDRSALPGGALIGQEGGNCPVQVEGAIEGDPFYFRARGSAWSLEVNCGCAIAGPEPVAPDRGGWRTRVAYGGFAEAGWMSPEHVGICVARALHAYLEDRDARRLVVGEIFERERLEGVPDGPDRP